MSQRIDTRGIQPDPPVGVAAASSTDDALNSTVPKVDDHEPVIQCVDRGNDCRQHRCGRPRRTLQHLRKFGYYGNVLERGDPFAKIRMRGI